MSFIEFINGEFFSHDGAFLHRLLRLVRYNKRQLRCFEQYAYLYVYFTNELSHTGVIQWWDWENFCQGIDFIGFDPGEAYRNQAFFYKHLRKSSELCMSKMVVDPEAYADKVARFAVQYMVNSHWKLERLKNMLPIAEDYFHHPNVGKAYGQALAILKCNLEESGEACLIQRPRKSRRCS